MARIRKVAARAAGFGATFALAAVLVGVLSAPAGAQAPPFSAYGTGLQPGDTVAAQIEGKPCGEVPADADGNWLIQIDESAECAPTEGAEITFTLNGEPTSATATYAPGGTPADVANGIDLAAGSGPATEESAEESAGAASTQAPAPADTGNAGLIADRTPAILVAALAVATVGLVAAARLVRRQP